MKVVFYLAFLRKMDKSDLNHHDGLTPIGNIQMQEMQILGAGYRSKFLGARLPVIFLPIKNKH